MQRKALEQRLTELALHIGEKSSQAAANALLELYKDFRFEALNEELSHEFEEAEDQIKARLKARLAELQSTTSAPVVPATSAPVKSEPAAPAPTPVEIPAEPAATEPTATEPEPIDAVAEPEALQEVAPAPEPAPAPAAPAVEETAPVTPDAPKATPTPEPTAQPTTPRAPKSLNDRLAGKKLTFGLNDRIGFVKALFDGSTEDFNRVVSQLNTMETLAEAQDFLNQMVAPDYNWEAQEEVAARFMDLVEQRFG
ncbi:MAG: hypothetical protein RL754_872 [Bacteroidota bacterium]|jgi:hypothetical protein